MSDTRYAFITGAASGIGRATVRKFIDEGWLVGAADLDEAGLATLEAEVGGNQCRNFRLDVTDLELFRGVIGEFAEWSGGQLDLLYNNAGIGVLGRVGEVPMQRQLDQINVNLIGVLNGIEAALPLLKATPNSLCFSTASAAAIYGSPSLAVYSATKFAVKGLTEALAVEFRAFDSRAADVLPGLIDTPILNAEHWEGGRDISTGERNIGAMSGMEPTPPTAVADAVFAAYSSDKVHWYVPEYIEEMEQVKLQQGVEAMRDARLAAQAGAAGPSASGD